MPTPDLSVVIGFRDWGIERLRRSVASLSEGFGALDGEIIISDYGSTDPARSRQIAQNFGTRWVYTPGDPVWSRSRALNAGFAVADGGLLVSTDADMLFAPGTLEAVHAEATSAVPCAVFLQCRDLPEHLPEEALEPSSEIPWSDLERQSRLRPRWGMGGLMAIDRDGFSLLHGYDERLQIYGREDLDFALRARRAGRRTHWVRSPRARMYHMWHPPTLAAAQESEAGREAMARNRRIVDSDMTTSRNLQNQAPLRDGRPLVSILVTGSEDAEGLHRTVATALAQTVRDVEVIVCDHGPEHAPLSLEDVRIRRHRMVGESPEALSAALASSRGAYISIIRSGDLLPLERTEKLLAAITEGRSGAIGMSVRGGDNGDLIPYSDDHEYASVLLRRGAAQSLAEVLCSASGTSTLSGDPFRRTGLVVEEVNAPALLTLRSSVPGESTAVRLSDSEKLSLRLLLPDGHAGAVERTALLTRIRGDLPEASFDGLVEHDQISQGDATISGGMSVKGASYSDLVALAQLNGELRVHQSAETTSDASRDWVGQIIEHSIAAGTTLPLALHRDDGSSSAPPGLVPYVVHSLGGDLAIRTVATELAPEVASEAQPRRPWVLIGAEIEEVWG